jgi:K+-transporting ATPase KdpF subunit
MSISANACEPGARIMILDYVLGGIVTVGLFGYLVYALVRPEKF